MACALAGLSLTQAQGLLPGDHEALPGESESTGFLAGSLLPDGGILKNVIIPQYKRDLQLASTFRAEELVIVTRRNIDVHRLRIDFFNPDQSPRGHILMNRAGYDADRSILETQEPVSLVSSDLSADGSGLVYDVKNSRGFLHGPVTAITKADHSTAMNSKPVRHALAAGALVLTTANPLPAEPSSTDIKPQIEAARLSPARVAQLDTDAASQKPQATAAAQKGEEQLRQNSEAEKQAAERLTQFFQDTSLSPSQAAPTSGEVPRPEVEPDPTKTRITSDEGAFFDSENGLLVFLKNVKVADPRFKLSGADELKVFFEPKKAVKAAPDKKDDSPLGSGGFGKPTRMVANGTVVVDYQSEDPAEPALKASARMLVYDITKKEIILRGGSPWILRDGQVSSVPGDDAYIVIQKDGSFVTGNGGIDASVDTQPRKKATKNR